MSHHHEAWCPREVLPADFPTKGAVCVCTDGSGNPNTGIGSWACVLRRPGGEVEEYAQAAPNTTNNLMEMEAVIQALRRVAPSVPLIIVSDSQYVIRGAAIYLPKWRSSGWYGSKGKLIANIESWKRLDQAQNLQNRHVHYHHVRGHRGHPGNERADALCTKTVSAFIVSLLTPA